MAARGLGARVITITVASSTVSSDNSAPPVCIVPSQTLLPPPPTQALRQLSDLSCTPIWL